MRKTQSLKNIVLLDTISDEDLQLAKESGFNVLRFEDVIIEG